MQNGIRDFIATCWEKIKPFLLVLSVLVRNIWLLLPGILFLVFAFLCFWMLSQGKDVLIDMLEKKWMGGIVLLAIIFWVMATWYSSRLIVYRKESLYRQHKSIGNHMPRLMGYLCFSIIWISLLALPQDAYVGITLSPLMQFGLLALSIGLYFILNKKFGKIRDEKISKLPLAVKDHEITDEMEEAEKKRFIIVFKFVACLVIGLLSLNTIITSSWLKILSIIALQISFHFLVVIRRGRVPATQCEQQPLPHKLTDQKTITVTEHKKLKEIKIGRWEKFLFNNRVPVRESLFFKAYNYVSAASLLVYLFLIFNYPFSVTLGSFATVIIGFGVLVGFFSAVTFSSVVSKVNLHLVLWILVFVFGFIFEPHNATIINTKTPNTKVSALRPGLYQYFDDWVNVRLADINKDSTYPVFFVLADGGASRSGYWTSSVLGKLEDTTNGNFSKHIFCLSGASGGSVGNGTFLALLKHRDELKSKRQNFVEGTQDFLRSDFLTFTAARMLGPDMFRPIAPLPFIDDRAAALEHAMEQAENSMLQQKFAKAFTEYFPVQTDSFLLPAIVINTTRMQDGRPSAISSIKLDRQTFGKRIDVLDSLKPGNDIKLSTAVVMGARFPYVSPAGRINDSYFVDGGYFDNSGAGFANEALAGLKKYIEANTAAKPYLSKLRFYVIHAQNGYYGAKISKVHPVVNDLAAPILTLFGTYGTQTSVNDWRLQKYLESINPKEPKGGYWQINLYAKMPYEKPGTKSPEYPMNWVISNYYLEKMNTKLGNDDMVEIISWMKNTLKL